MYKKGTKPNPQKRPKSSTKEKQNQGKETSLRENVDVQSPLGRINHSCLLGYLSLWNKFLL